MVRYSVGENFTKMRFSFPLLLCLIVKSNAAGRSLVDGRIVGGTDANIASFPYQISLRRSGSHTCGGSILNENTILTAAHCVHYIKRNPSDFSIRAGSTYRNEGGQVISAKEIISHENYNDWTLEWDIAIIKLDSDLVFNAEVQPISLPKRGLKVPAKTLANVSGWGTLFYHGSASTHLLNVTVPVVDEKTCAKAYKTIGQIKKYQLCAGETGKDACQGDSGGPLVWKNNVIGLVSWGYGCAFEGYPTVYTRVSEFIGWIQQHI